MDLHIKFSVSNHSKQRDNNFWFPVVPSKHNWDPLHRWEDYLELTEGGKKASTAKIRKVTKPRLQWLAYGKQKIHIQNKSCIK